MLRKSENGTAKQAGRNGAIKGFIGGIIAMAIIFTVTVKIMRQTSYQEVPVARDYSTEDSIKVAISSECQSTSYASPFHKIAEEIAQTETCSQTKVDTSLHFSYNWEEPEEGNGWLADKNYRISLPLPSDFMDVEHKIAVNVDYPDMVAAGETGVITITAKDEAGVVCTGEYPITPSADLHLMHGEYLAVLDEVVGDAIDISAYKGAIVINFCTFADKYDGERLDDIAVRHGYCPTTVVLFNRSLKL